MDNRKYNVDDHIELQKIIKSAVGENKSIILSIILLFTAYWLQDVVFTNKFSKFTTNVKGFVDTISFKSVMGLIYPFLIAEVLFYANSMIVSHSIPKIEMSMVNKLTDMVIESMKTSKKQINTNEFVMNLKKVIESKSLYYLVVSYIVPTILVGLGLIYYFCKADVKVGGVILLIIILFFIITLGYEKESINASYENEDMINTFYDGIQDVVTNSDTVIVYGSKDKEIKNINNESKHVLKKYVGSETLAGEVSFKLHLISLATVILFDGIAIYMYMSGKMPVDLLVSICIISILFMQYYNSTISKIKSTIGQIGKYYEINDYFASFNINKAETNDGFMFKKGNIEFKNINLAYENKTIMKNFNYTITGGSKIGIIGSVGTGKTSLLKMLAGLLNYDGSIYIDDQDISKYKYESVMKHVAYISQHPKMFNKTIYYNLAYGSNYTQEDIWKQLDKYKFKDFFSKFKEKLDTPVGKEGSKLSGGQKQIVAIIRALIQNKSIILLDEPTSSLDTETKDKLIDLLKEIKNKTILVVTHDKDLLEVFDDFIIFK